MRLPANHFFIHDLIDVNVFIKDEKIGVVTDILKLPANDVLVVKRNDNTEQLIPFVVEFIEKFQLLNVFEPYRTESPGFFSYKVCCSA